MTQSSRTPIDQPPTGQTPTPQSTTGARERSDPAIVAAQEEAGGAPAPSQQGSAGGNMAREVGQRDEVKTAAGGDPLPTSVDGRDKPEDGDLPTRLQTRE